MRTIDRVTLKVLGALTVANEHIDPKIMAEEYLAMFERYSFALSIDEVEMIQRMCHEVLDERSSTPD